MSSELYYMSAARGLKPHSRGFCTVARTDGMLPPVVERLESLSNYEPVFAAGSPMAARNPQALAHWRISVGARTRSVLSRVAFVESDFTGRPGKFAHHVLLEPGEQSEAGPVAMLLTPGIMQDHWQGEPMLLPPRVLPADDQRVTALPNCLTGEGVDSLVRAFELEPEKPVYIIYEPGGPLLELLGLAMNRIDPLLRWQVTFATHFTELPAGLSCLWRCVVANTLAAKAARASSNLVIDLTPTA